MNRSTHRFREVHDHAASVRDWDQTYCQMSAGRLDSSLVQLHGSRCHVFRERINQRVVQHGAAPRGRVCFAVPVVMPGPLRMQGREADERSIFVLRPGEEFVFHMPTGMDMLAVTFDRQYFEARLAQSTLADEIGRLLRQPVIRVPPRRLDECRQRLLDIVAHAPADDPAVQACEGPFEDALLANVLDLLADPDCDRRQRHGASPHSYIVDTSHRLATIASLEAPSVMALCERFRVSRRTVQNSFRTVAGTTPLNYLRCVRLNGVRRLLTSTRALDLCVGDAAARWGFFHLSHFAAEYRGLFDELPSQTRRAPR